MEYVNLGATGLQVAPIAVGCMSFGEPGRGTHAWTLDEDRSRRVIATALELGLNFFDTANMYSDGTGEEILGRALRDMGNLDELVVATKVFFGMGDGPNRGGLSRKAIQQEVDASRRRLGIDTIDLLQIHRFDPRTPIDETLIALDGLVRSGAVRYLGASSMPAWRFVLMRERQRELGLATFVSMQNQYSLISREDERELLPYCAHAGVASIPWSPLGRGKLTRPWGTTTDRVRTDEVMQGFYRQAVDSDHAVVDAVEAVAAERGIPMAHVAIAWLRRNPAVTAPIIGATDEAHLRDAVAALDVVLTDEEAACLEEPYAARLPELY